MRTILLVLGLFWMATCFSCQKEDHQQLTESPTNKIVAQQQLEKLLPSNAFIIDDYIPDETIINGPRPGMPILLDDCKGNNCFRRIPTNVKALQQKANEECRMIQLSFCCCYLGNSRCFQIAIYPEYRCPLLEKKVRVFQQSTPDKPAIK